MFIHRISIVFRLERFTNGTVGVNFCEEFQLWSTVITRNSVFTRLVLNWTEHQYINELRMNQTIKYVDICDLKIIIIFRFVFEGWTLDIIHKYLNLPYI